MSLYGIEKYKLERYEKLIDEIFNDCESMDQAGKLILEAQKEIKIYSEGYEAGRPKGGNSIYDR